MNPDPLYVPEDEPPVHPAINRNPTIAFLDGMIAGIVLVLVLAWIVKQIPWWL
jgi:capsular polysaccharide biosynthesis protein